MIEKVAGQSLDRFVAAKITGPLGMVDTGYAVPESKRSRLAKIYSRDKNGALKEADLLAHVSVDGTGFARGGAGMFSTIADYARFGQMLLNGGELDGTRVLGRKSVELMMANQLVNLAQPTTEPGGGYGFGYGGGVRVALGGDSVPGSLGRISHENGVRKVPRRPDDALLYADGASFLGCGSARRLRRGKRLQRWPRRDAIAHVDTRQCGGHLGRNRQLHGRRRRR